MVYRHTPPDDHPLDVRKKRLATRPWHEYVMAMPALSSVTSNRVRPDYLSDLRSGSDEAILIELGSRRGEWVSPKEFTNVYGLSLKATREATGRLRKKYPGLVIENRTSVGYRVVGPLPAHVERIAPK